ncbi:phosphatase PAP2 family protein [Comamonas composti]|uniref:phosphatase PAP2 family protein n=1 Tax=Comamonas composti TaxID=408558 RepID=UPI00041768E9|nr:phosphatase PAP2 family protein [Comamonas composti]
MPVSWKRRLGAMLQGWGLVGVVYSLGRAAWRESFVLDEGLIDRWIGFEPAAIWLYLSFFAFVPVAYFCAPLQRIGRLKRSMQLSALLCAPVFLLWPTTLVYPAIPEGGLSAQALQMLAAVDSRENCLPSLHGALTVICALVLWDRHRPWKSAALALWGLAILWSVVAARRHLFIDLGAGVAIGLACHGLLARYGAAWPRLMRFQERKP